MDAENDRRVDYLEFPTTDLQATKAFFGSVFGWQFKDYGPDYASYNDGRLAGGFYTAPAAPSGGTLAVLYAADLEGTEARVREAGGTIVKEIFSFPGGRRFHFVGPGGTELAV